MQALCLARRYHEAIAAFGTVISLDPDDKQAYCLRGLAYYGLGDFQRARSSCETKPDDWESGVPCSDDTTSLDSMPMPKPC